MIHLHTILQIDHNMLIAADKVTMGARMGARKGAYGDRQFVRSTFSGSPGGHTERVCAGLLRRTQCLHLIKSGTPDSQETGFGRSSPLIRHWYRRVAS